MSNWNRNSRWNKWPDEDGFDNDEEYDDEDEEEEYDEDDDDEDDDEPFYGGRGGWNYYAEHRPLRVTGGIKAKSTRGNIGETWWSKRWLKTLESFGMGTRLTRGRSYARQGQVRSLDIQSGVVKAKVQGSMPKPYTITIELHPLSDAEWERVAEVMASQALFSAKLLAGEMPTNIEEAFSTVKLSLFPTQGNDLHTQCSCPDWANPCKHIAAVYYILAEQFDEDPFLIFKLRGRTKEQLIGMLRDRRAEMAPQGDSSSTSTGTSVETTTPVEVLRLEDRLTNFWQAGEGLDQFTIRPRPPEVDKALLKRLGDSPFKPGKENLTAKLARVYDVVRDAAQHKISGEDV